MKAIITVGISASGKSTFAANWIKSGSNRIDINRDEIRKFIIEEEDKNYPFTWAKWNFKREKEVNGHVSKLLDRAQLNLLDIIISDTNLNNDRRINLTKLLESYGFEVEVMDFPIDIETAWKRDAARANGVGHSVIANQYEQWLQYTGQKNPDRYTEHKDIFTANPEELPSCILVDIDGTLAHMNSKRGAFEWSKVELDDVDVVVRDMVNLYANDKIVIVLSGRDGCCHTETSKWLIDNNVKYDRLIMRAPNDMRKDTIVKEEIFWRDIVDNYNVELVIDDRPSVCRMWRNIGLKVFQVGNPHIEF